MKMVKGILGKCMEFPMSHGQAASYSRKKNKSTCPMPAVIMCPLDPSPKLTGPWCCPHMPTVLCWDLCLSYKLCFKWGPHIQLQGPASNPSTESCCLLSQEGSLTPPLEATIPTLQAAHVLLCCTGIILNFVCVVHLCSSVYLEGTQYGFDD